MRLSVDDERIRISGQTVAVLNGGLHASLIVIRITIAPMAQLMVIGRNIIAITRRKN